LESFIIALTVFPKKRAFQMLETRSSAWSYYNFSFVFISD